jgi:hypothetical protein
MTTHSSKACCETPAAVSEDYTAQGTYQTIANTKCYITGPRDAQKAIYLIYDVFGFTDPTLQGAEILASQGQHPYLVIIPDLFDGQPVQPEWYANKEEEENKKKIAEFISKLQDPIPHVKRVLEIQVAAKEEFTTVESWGVIGCKSFSLFLVNDSCSQTRRLLGRKACIPHIWAPISVESSSLIKPSSH